MKSRNNLDDFVSMHCFKAAIAGMEDILGVEGAASAMISAGRKRGGDVAKAAGLVGTNPAAESLGPVLDGALGLNGTRLCQVLEVSKTADDGFLVKTRETVCTSAEPAGSQRKCTYTLGAVMGFLESVYGTTLRGSHVATVLNGSSTDDLQFVRV